jgi:hypothetical protein
MHARRPDCPPPSPPGRALRWPAGAQGAITTSSSPSSASEQRVLGRLVGGGGAVPQVFDEQREEWPSARALLRELAGEPGYEAARRTTPTPALQWRCGRPCARS